MRISGGNYQEKIWDHAAGAVIVEEAGGSVCDLNGQPLDFSVGRTLAKNKVSTYKIPFFGSKLKNICRFRVLWQRMVRSTLRS